jgi:riboflavin synthase
MFTGIVEELGTVVSVTPVADGARIVVGASTVLADARIGDSIAVNGCCLTVVEHSDGSWAADAVTETLDRTALGALAPGARVNLERPVRVADRLGGHIVQGHVDGVGTLVARDALADGSTRMRFAVPPALLRYVVEKGSITLDGISLTVAAVDDPAAAVEIAVIPHTLTVTTLGAKMPGDPVNIEVDVLAKHVERLLTVRETPGERPRSSVAGRPPGEASGTER